MLRYFIIASGVFWMVWKVFKNRNAPFKLDPRPLDVAQIRREIGWSMCSLVLFSFVAVSIVWLRREGFTKIYGSVSEHGMPYFVSSIFMMLMVSALCMLYASLPIFHPLEFKPSFTMFHPLN
jgi:hypothetical protein